MLLDLDDKGERLPKVRFAGANTWQELEPGMILRIPGGNMLQINDDRVAGSVQGYVACVLSTAVVVFIICASLGIGACS